METGSGCKTCASKGGGSVQGKIVWLLRKSGPNASPALAEKVGTTSTEQVKAQVKGEGLLVLDGYDKDDPNDVKALDQYRLAISDNGKVVGGISLNGGSWTGQFIAVRVQLLMENCQPHYAPKPKC